MTTVEQIIEAYDKCKDANDEVESVSALYPIEGVAFESALYELALTRKKTADDALKALVAAADKAVIEEARQIVRARKPTTLLK